MKKIINKISILFLISILLFTIKNYAAVLDNVDISVDKANIKPGEEVKVTVDFGEELGQYTVNILYDKKIFDYKSVEGGTASDEEDKKIVVKNEGEAKKTVTVTFKAKDDIITTNPTEFIISAEDLMDSEKSSGYDNIASITKTVIVEPEYVDYAFNIESTGDIYAKEDKNMTISLKSSLGKHYAKARIIASAVTPEGGKVSIKGIDLDETEYDIIESGWGNAQGYEIGGVNYSKELSVKGNFSMPGDYTITLSLIDREDSDKEIIKKVFPFTVLEAKTNEAENGPEKPTENPSETPAQQVEENNTEENTTPTRLPKTGINYFIPCFAILFLIIGLMVYYNKRK